MLKIKFNSKQSQKNEKSLKIFKSLSYNIITVIFQLLLRYNLKIVFGSYSKCF